MCFSVKLIGFRSQSGFPTFISCQRQDANVLPKRRQSHQGDKLYDVSTVPLVARWPVFLARGSDADGEPHCCGLRRWLYNYGVPAGICMDVCSQAKETVRLFGCFCCFPPPLADLSNASAAALREAVMNALSLHASQSGLVHATPNVFRPDTGQHIWWWPSLSLWSFFSGLLGPFGQSP